MQLLRQKGWVCSRSAMSHGPVDVFAAKNGNVLLIQVKIGSARIKKFELDLLKKWAEAFDARAEVWSFRKRGKLEKKVVRSQEFKKSRRLESVVKPRESGESSVKQTLEQIEQEVEKDRPGDAPHLTRTIASSPAESRALESLRPPLSSA